MENNITCSKSYISAKSKLQLLGYEIINENGWAIVFKDNNGNIRVINTTASNSTITGVIRYVELVANFIILDKGEYNPKTGVVRRVTEVYIKNCDKNVLGRLKNLVIRRGSHDYDTLILFGKSSMGDGYIINHLGKRIKVALPLTARQLSVRTDLYNSDLHYLESVSLEMRAEGDIGYNSIPVMKFTTDLNKIERVE